jgi:molybdopterin-guanine dinucleotide biosynthesis protein A
MHHAESSHLFVVAGDMPFLQETAISKLMELSQQHPRHAVIPYTNGGPEPLHAVYPVAVKEQLDHWLKIKNDLSVKSFLSQIPVHYWQTDVSTPFININTPEELQYYEKN